MSRMVRFGVGLVPKFDEECTAWIKMMNSLTGKDSEASKYLEEQQKA